ncbi:MAG TPA: carboxypeptidase-like regulatory domain-containing protein [Terriglobia bacterium]|nr:carboxypeptidase-like regulatory domain-containing protein [Terriglobia bacterium]
MAAAPRARGAGYGRVSGTVNDVQGSPLVGVTVLVMASSAYNFDHIAHRVITDTHGRFTVEHLLPGRYSLRITSATHLPVMRNDLQVTPGSTVDLHLILGDIFAPFRLQAPAGSSVTLAGDDWKWVLRTSASTRPILRFKPDRSNSSRRGYAASQRRAFGVMPGVDRSNPLAADPGLGSVMAYSRALSDDADWLVAGSMGAGGFTGSSLVTAFRRNLAGGNPQELALVVHQLNLTQGAGSPAAAGIGSLANAQGVVASYTQARRLTPSLTLTSGLEMDYLDALSGALAASPRASLEYRAGPSTLLTLKYGASPVAGDGTLLDRVGDLTAFPRVTLRGYRPELEQAHHAEVSVTHRLGANSTVEVAAYRDSFQDAVVRGFGNATVWQDLEGNFLPNTVSNGVNLDAGNYRSVGFRSTVTRRIGAHVQAAVLYSNGDALVLTTGPRSQETQSVRNVRDALRTSRSDSIAGKLLAQVPGTKTTVITSYEWVGRGRVTGVDPYGQAGLGIDPYLGVQIRQPLPSPGFLPARIEAVADFQNLLAQGYARLAGAGGQPLVLTPAYRSFRGGFSVQF